MPHRAGRGVLVVLGASGGAVVELFGRRRRRDHRAGRRCRGLALRHRAQPRASASYCDHVGCASPPPPAARTGPGTAPAPSPAPAPAASAVGSPTVSGGTTPATGSSGADSGTKAGAAASALDRGAAEDGGQDERDGSAARATQGDAPSTSAASERARRRLDGDAEAALAAPSGDDGDGGSPIGVAVASGLLVVAAVVAVVSERSAPALSVVPARPSALGPRRPSTRSRANSITRLPFGDADAISNVRSRQPREPRCQRLLRASHAAQGVRRRDRQPVLGGRPLIGDDVTCATSTTTRSLSS